MLTIIDGLVSVTTEPKITVWYCTTILSERGLHLVEDLTRPTLPLLVSSHWVNMHVLEGVIDQQCGSMKRKIDTQQLH